MTLSEQDTQKVATIKERMRELGEKMQPLRMYTRPLGKASQPFAVAQALERRYNVYATEYSKLDSKLRKIYRANGMEGI